MKAWFVVVALLGCGPTVEEETDRDEDRDELEQACKDGCAQLMKCGVDPAVDPPPDCSDCLEFWGDCPHEAAAFIDCTSTLECDEFLQLQRDPRDTACKSTFEAAQAACGF